MVKNKELKNIGAPKEIDAEKVKDFHYEDLPNDTKKAIERILIYRKSLGLDNDAEDRKQRAIRYFIFQRDKK